MNYCKTKGAPIYATVPNVKITDAFFAPFIEKIRNVTTPDVFKKFFDEGAIENYERVARGDISGHVGPPWYHGLICEVIRGVSDLLAVKYDKAIDDKLDGIIDSIKRAQETDPEGWINPYTTLMCPESRWGLNGGNARWQHEMYDMGALVEAGVHHYRATGKTTLLKVAVKMANYVAERVGEAPKWNVVCEHALPEMALVSLERLFDEYEDLAEKVGAVRGEYIRLASFFVNNKGNHKKRHQFPPFLQEYAQDHRPAREQLEAVGHAVRAVLFYTGMSEVALAEDDKALAEAAIAIWKDITETKLHINGCVGCYPGDEKFGQQYDLPNNAYLETCAGVGLAFFGASLFRITKDAKIWDTVENTLNNVMPASVSADGTHYTYENPLETKGGIERWSWHGCPCCPPMLLKLVGVMPSYIAAIEKDDLYLNLYIDSEISFGSVKLALENKVIKVESDRDITLHVRIPDWAYNFGMDRAYRVENGYAVIDLSKGENNISLSYDKKIVKVMAHPYVGADIDRVAIKYGPVLYCCEKEVEKWEDLDPLLSENAPVMNADATIDVETDLGTFKLIEYRNWNNNGALPMRIWFRQSGYKTDKRNLCGWEGKLYRDFASF